MYIGEAITGIGGSAFYHCEALAGTAFPNRLTAIGKYAFYDGGSKENRDEISIGSSNSYYLTGAAIHYNS